MVYATNELFDQSSAPIGSKPRVVPMQSSPKTFAAVGAAPLYAKGTPVAFDTSVAKWKVWANAGINGVNLIAGFIFPDDLQTDAVNDTLATVMVAGTINYNDIVLPAGETAANLKTACRSGPRGLGLEIVGLDQVH